MDVAWAGGGQGGGVVDEVPGFIVQGGVFVQGEVEVDVGVGGRGEVVG